MMSSWNFHNFNVSVCLSLTSGYCTMVENLKRYWSINHKFWSTHAWNIPKKKNCNKNIMLMNSILTIKMCNNYTQIFGVATENTHFNWNIHPKYCKKLVQIGSIYQLKYIRVINEKVMYRKKYKEGKRSTDFVLHKILQLTVSIKMKR